MGAPRFGTADRDYLSRYLNPADRWTNETHVPIFFFNGSTVEAIGAEAQGRLLFPEGLL